MKPGILSPVLSHLKKKDMKDQRVVYKYPLLITDKQTVQLPQVREILCVQSQAGTPCLWAYVDPHSEVEPVEIITMGTGHVWSKIAQRYISTYQLVERGLVFHVFEKLLK